MNKYILTIIILGVLLLGIFIGIFMASYAVSQITKNDFCMENWFAEQVLSCYVGNQSRCLNITWESAK